MLIFFLGSLIIVVSLSFYYYDYYGNGSYVSLTQNFGTEHNPPHKLEKRISVLILYKHFQKRNPGNGDLNFQDFNTSYLKKYIRKNRQLDIPKNKLKIYDAYLNFSLEGISYIGSPSRKIINERLEYLVSELENSNNNEFNNLYDIFFKDIDYTIFTAVFGAHNTDENFKKNINNLKNIENIELIHEFIKIQKNINNDTFDIIMNNGLNTRINHHDFNIFTKITNVTLTTELLKLLTVTKNKTDFIILTEYLMKKMNTSTVECFKNLSIKNNNISSSQTITDFTLTFFNYAKNSFLLNDFNKIYYIGDKLGNEIIKSYKTYDGIMPLEWQIELNTI